MESRLDRATADRRREAADALDDLLAVLTLADTRLPTVEVDWRHGRLTGTYLIRMGSASPDVINRVVELLRKGLRHEREAEARQG
ncbi:hypothetical protein [Kitasatospora sp. NPDC088351]|uniref:hypothetical protein n=1 Tax=unclassified Kitasatospora TaxID=2633591 RepID=UPI003413AD1C